MAPPHGKASTYRGHGCRCELCTAANTERGKRTRAALAQRPADDVPHGLSGYINWGCRCEVCRAANTASCAEYKAARRAKTAAAADAPAVAAEETTPNPSKGTES